MSSENGGEPLLRLRGVSKNFGPVQALHGVDLEVRAGEVTALVGDNGAGKSVTIKTIAGIHSPDRGEIFWEGRPVRIRTPRDAAALGIETVYQDLALCNNLDIVQNMFLGRERTRYGALNEEDMETAAQEQVLDDVEVVAEREILEHSLNAESRRLAWRADLDRPALPVHLTGVGAVDPRDGLDGDRFAGAVVADQRRHLAGPQLQVDVGQRLHRPEVFGDVVEPQ